MARTISQYQTAPFTTPQNGQPADATQVLGNDNTVRTSANSHDADSGIHFQSSTLATRPVAGTAGRKWFSEDGFRVYYDDGSVWQEAAYALTASPTFTGIATFGGTIQVSGTNFSIKTATAHTIDLYTNATLRWTVNTSGHLVPNATNTYDLGAPGTTVRTLYVNSISSTAGIIVGASQVVNTRVTGYSAMTGTANTATVFDTATATLVNIAQRVKAIQDALTTHGLIGT